MPQYLDGESRERKPGRRGVRERGREGERKGERERKGENFLKGRHFDDSSMRQSAMEYHKINEFDH